LTLAWAAVVVAVVVVVVVDDDDEGDMQRERERERLGRLVLVVRASIDQQEIYWLAARGESYWSSLISILEPFLSRKT